MISSLPCNGEKSNLFFVLRKLSSKTKDKFVFSQLQGRELTTWNDDDDAGEKIAKKVQEVAQSASAK